MSIESQPKVNLAFLPTPLEHLARLSKLLNGPKILIKRDDQTGLALGGNKTRKLEYLLGDALKKDVDTLITAGSIQSNHCRQTAAAAAKIGLRCDLLLKGNPPKNLEGNLLLDVLFGANIYWQGEKGMDTLDDLARHLQSEGCKPYTIPYGGSNVYGVLGYVQAFMELMEQLVRLNEQISHLIFPSCSGATHVGLVVGAKLANFSGKIVGISVDYGLSQKDFFEKDLVVLANATSLHLGLKTRFTSEDFEVNYAYATGYGKVDQLEREAIHLLATTEGILLDPIYSGRAFGALLDQVKKGFFSREETLLFLHTGGTPALFADSSQLIWKLS